jgi:hypothetical protein
MIQSMERSLAEIDDRLKITDAEDLVDVLLKEIGIDSQNQKASEALGRLADFARHIGNSLKDKRKVAHAFSVLKVTAANLPTLEERRNALKYVLELEATFEVLVGAVEKVDELYAKGKKK